LLLQINTQHALSILDARNNKFYIGEYVNFKPKHIPCVLNQEQLEKLKEKYEKQEIFADYQNIDIFQNVLFHYKHFQKQTNINQIKLLYIKPPV
jgi:tRNA A37 threonylcarbamoyladenosine modification protein TsaB